MPVSCTLASSGQGTTRFASSAQAPPGLHMLEIASVKAHSRSRTCDQGLATCQWYRPLRKQAASMFTVRAAIPEGDYQP
jgi:hypothetical protein